MPPRQRQRQVLPPNAPAHVTRDWPLSYTSFHPPPFVNAKSTSTADRRIVVIPQERGADMDVALDRAAGHAAEARQRRRRWRRRWRWRGACALTRKRMTRTRSTELSFTWARASCVSAALRTSTQRWCRASSRATCGACGSRVRAMTAREHRQSRRKAARRHSRQRELRKLMQLLPKITQRQLIPRMRAM